MIESDADTDDHRSARPVLVCRAQGSSITPVLWVILVAKAGEIIKRRLGGASVMASRSIPWTCIWLPGMADRYMPHIADRDRDASEESRRR